jgi:hypothetical protein
MDFSTNVTLGKDEGVFQSIKNRLMLKASMGQRFNSQEKSTWNSNNIKTD